MNLPIKPDESDCCGSGCNPCIFDIYEQQLKLYLKKEYCSDSEETSSNCISQIAYTVFQLTNIEYDSENTNLYTFKYVRKPEDDENNCRLIFKPGQHFVLRGQEQNGGKYFSRPYSILPNKDKLSFTVLIKHLTNGQMSNFVHNLKIDDETFWRGPYGNFVINYKLKHILMIAQGTGIAPIYTIIKNIVENENCDTFIKLLFCCKNSENIHFRNDLLEMASNWNFTYEIFLGETNPFQKKYKEIIYVKRLNISDIQEYCNHKCCDTNYQVLICGSHEFSDIITGYCNSCNIKDEFIHRF